MPDTITDRGAINIAIRQLIKDQSSLRYAELTAGQLGKDTPPEVKVAVQEFRRLGEVIRRLRVLYEWMTEKEIDFIFDMAIAGNFDEHSTVQAIDAFGLFDEIEDLWKDDGLDVD